MTSKTSLTVFFDGNCPLCRREIAWYRKQRGAESIEWTDVSKVSEKNIISGLCTEDALRRLHVRLHDGDIVSGAIAFSAVWKQLTLFKPLGYFVGLPFVRNAAEIAYLGFLKIRPRLQRLFAR